MARNPTNDGLPERRHLPGENVRTGEIGQCLAPGVFRFEAFGKKIAPAIIEML
jgi:hypothetical protein